MLLLCTASCHGDESLASKNSWNEAIGCAVNTWHS